MSHRKAQPTYHRLTQKEKKVRAYTALLDLLDTTVWIRVELGEQLRSVGLTLGGFRLLEMLHREGRMSLPTAARKRRCTNKNLRVILDRLVDRGWVRHGPPTHLEDRAEGSPISNGKQGRKRAGRWVGFLSLTPKGEKFIGMIFPQYAQVVKALMRSLDAREQESLSRLCRKLRQGDARRFASEITDEDVDDQET